MTSQMLDTRARLRAVSRAYLRGARAMSYGDLCAKQDAPWASVVCGATGIAAALRHRREGQHPDLHCAAKWLIVIKRASAGPGAFWTEDFGPPTMRSIYFAADGIELVRLLVAGARRRARASSPAPHAFLKLCRSARGGPTELLRGVAGHLTGLVLLHGVCRHPRVLEVAEELAGDLLDGARAGRRWTRLPQLGFAHGRAGTFYSLLGWARMARRELPSSLFEDLEDFASEVAASGTMGAPHFEGASAEIMQRGWCNGAAGLVLLWARAYEHTRMPAYLRRAREAARFLQARTAGATGDLCCGLGGRAYALLAMDRIEPGRGWDARALAMAGLAFAAMLEGAGPWPNGLYKGYPGLVCLSRDVLSTARHRIGFPLVEG